MDKNRSSSTPISLNVGLWYWWSFLYSQCVSNRGFMFDTNSSLISKPTCWYRVLMDATGSSLNSWNVILPVWNPIDSECNLASLPIISSNMTCIPSGHIFKFVLSIVLGEHLNLDSSPVMMKRLHYSYTRSTVNNNIWKTCERTQDVYWIPEYPNEYRVEI